MLGGLVPGDHLADCDADLPGAGEPAGLDAGGDRGEQLLGGGQQLLPGAGAVGGQHGVAAGDEPLAGEIAGGDLRQVLLIEQGQLQRPVIGHQLPDRRGSQRGDPPVGVRPLRAVLQQVQRPDAGAGDHAPVPDHDHPGQPELVPRHLHDLGERGGVAGAAGEHPDRDGAALGVGEQPVLDLQLALLAVAGVAAGRQRAAPALHPRGRQVEQRHPRRVDRRGQVAGGQPCLDRVLPGAEPVHRRVDVISGRAGNAQVGPEGGVVPPGQRGQLGGGGHDPGDDKGHGQVPRPARRAQQGGQAQPGGDGVHGGDVAVRQRPGDGDRLAGRDQMPALQSRVDQVDDVVRQDGEVGDGLVLDLAAVAVGAPQVRRGVVLAAALLVHVPGLADSDYVYLPASLRHTPIITALLRVTREDTPEILTTS